MVFLTMPSYVNHISHFISVSHQPAQYVAEHAVVQLCITVKIICTLTEVMDMKYKTWQSVSAPHTLLFIHFL